MSKGFILKALVVKKLELKFIAMGPLPPISYRVIEIEVTKKMFS